MLSKNFEQGKVYNFCMYRKLKTVFIKLTIFVAN